MQPGEPTAQPTAQPIAQPTGPAPPQPAPGALRLASLEAPADVQACVTMMQASDPWRRLGVSREACHRTLTHPQRLVVGAWRDEALAGFVVLSFEGPFSGYVQLLGVDAAARRQGVGRALMDQAERIAFARGPNLFLCVSGFNTGAQRFYARLGFEEVGRLRDYLVAGEDEWLLRKTRGPILGAGPQPVSAGSTPQAPRAG